MLVVLSYLLSQCLLVVCHHHHHHHHLPLDGVELVGESEAADAADSVETALTGDEAVLASPLVEGGGLPPLVLERVVDLDLPAVLVVSPPPHSVKSPARLSQSQAGPGVAERGEVVPLLAHVVKHLHAGQEPAGQL